MSKFKVGDVIKTMLSRTPREVIGIRYWNSEDSKKQGISFPGSLCYVLKYQGYKNRIVLHPVKGVDNDAILSTEKGYWEKEDND